jgi:hypothetical protein
MKTIQTLSLFLLFCFSAQAQSHKTNLTKTVESINSILCQDRNAQFTNQDYKLFYPTKINANLQGDVFCIESSTRFGKESNGLMFNLLRVKSFIIKADELLAIGHHQETIIAIALGNELERQAVRKELYALLFICRQYAEQDLQFKCDFINTELK